MKHDGAMKEPSSVPQREREEEEHALCRRADAGNRTSGAPAWSGRKPARVAVLDTPGCLQFPEQPTIVGTNRAFCGGFSVWNTRIHLEKRKKL